MRFKEASVLLSSLVGMMMIYLSVSCLLAVCCASHPAFLYKRRLNSASVFKKGWLCTDLILQVLYSAQSRRKGWMGFQYTIYTLYITSCFKYNTTIFVLSPTRIFVLSPNRIYLYWVLLGYLYWVLLGYLYWVLIG